MLLLPPVCVDRKNNGGEEWYLPSLFWLFFFCQFPFAFRPFFSIRCSAPPKPSKESKEGPLNQRFHGGVWEPVWLNLDSATDNLLIFRNKGVSLKHAYISPKFFLALSAVFAMPFLMHRSWTIFRFDSISFFLPLLLTFPFPFFFLRTPNHVTAFCWAPQTWN